jgi:hypothetical protein
MGMNGIKGWKKLGKQFKHESAVFWIVWPRNAEIARRLKQTDKTAEHSDRGV